MDLRQAILETQDKRVTKVHVPEWGIDVYLMPMSVGDRDAWENEWLERQNKGGVSNFRSKFLVKCLCDESGRKLFTDADVEKLAAKSSSVVCRLFELARKENALTQDQVDELAKN